MPHKNQKKKYVSGKTLEKTMFFNPIVIISTSRWVSICSKEAKSWKKSQDQLRTKL